MSPEGEILIEAAWRPGEVHDLRLAVRRPQGARLLRGRSAAQARALVPALFSLCAQAQGAAAELALAAARGEAVPEARRRELGEAVLREALREHLWRLLLDWPALLGLAVERARHAALHRALANPSWGRGGEAAALAAELGLAGAGLRGWSGALMDAGSKLEAARPAPPLPTPALLRPEGCAAWAVRLRRVPDADFCACPQVDGAPRETGALASHAGHPEVAALLAAGQPGAARLRARLVALAEGLARIAGGAGAMPLEGGAALPEGGGLAALETARGLLIHAYALDGDVIAACAVVAPTEWNFNAGGAFALEGARVGAQTRADAQRGLQALALGLDPCVGFKVVVVAS